MIFMKHPYFGSPKHLAHLRRIAAARRVKRDLEWFLKSVNKTSACWEWIGSLDKDGYGVFTVRSRNVDGKLICRLKRAHRHSWSLHYGDIPHGLWVLHDCDNPKCVRPDHLFLGTNLDNVKDRERKGRTLHMRGEGHPRASISNVTARRIKEMLQSGLKMSVISRQLSVKYQTVANIKNGSHFAWLNL